MYFDMEGELEGINEKTGDTLSIKLIPRSWNTGSSVNGKAMDKDGKVKFEISGSWTDKIYVKNNQTGANDCIWTREAPIENMQQQYGMRKLSILLNHLENKGLDPKTGKLIIAPTDTRFRNDQRLFEQGQVPEADDEKLRLEIKQRQARKDLADKNLEHKTVYFEKYQEQNPWSKQMEDRFKLIEGPNSYWEKRK